MAATVTLPSAEEIRITREFDAPRPDVQALTTVTFTYMGDGLDDAMDHLEQVALALARDGR